MTALAKRVSVGSDARVQGGGAIQQVLSVAGKASKQFAIGVITDTSETCRTFSASPIFLSCKTDFSRNDDLMTATAL